MNDDYGLQQTIYTIVVFAKNRRRIIKKTRLDGALTNLFHQFATLESE
jgi:hypothetical protein